MNARGLLLVLAGTVVASPALASGGACSGRQPEVGIPLRIPLGPADFGAVPAACPANEALLQGWGAILIATQDFYGSAFAGAAPQLRVKVGGPWISLHAPGVQYGYVANATVTADSWEMSAGSLGLHVPLAAGRRLTVAPFVRVLLPTETIYQRATRLGIDHGVAAVWRAHRMFELVGGVSFPLLLTVNRPSVYTVQIQSASVDASFEPWRFLAVVGGFGIRLRAGSSSPLESVDPRVGLRLYPYSGTLVELASAFPILGADRTDLLASLSLGWTWQKK